MNKFESFLSAAGKDIKKGVDFFLPLASVAATGISVLNPALGGIINTSIGVVIATEKQFAGVAGSGSQKLAQTVTILYPAFEQLFAQAGVKIDSSQVEAYINAIVAALNAFPAIPAPGAGGIPIPPVAAQAAAKPVVVAQPVAVAAAPETEPQQAGG